jgi:hypothetical protein
MFTSGGTAAEVTVADTQLRAWGCQAARGEDVNGDMSYTGGHADTLPSQIGDLVRVGR